MALSPEALPDPTVDAELIGTAPLGDGFPLQVTVVAVTYGDRWHLLERVLEAARREAAVRAIVVDNGSRRDISTLTRVRFGDFADVVRLGRNTGSAGGYRTGMARALELGAEFVLLLDDDNMLEAGCLAQLSADYLLWSHRVPASLLAVLAFRPGRQTDVAAQVPASGMRDNRSAFFGFRLSDVPFKLFRRTSVGRAWLARRPVVPHVAVAIAPYGGMFFHCSALVALGLPNEDFVLYADDTDFSYRFTRRGGRIVLATRARISDLESSWGTKADFGNTLDALLMGESDLRAYYSTRNNAYFEKWSRDSSSLKRSLNRAIYLLGLYLRAKARRRDERFKLLLEAVRDGEAGRLGEHPAFPLE